MPTNRHERRKNHTLIATRNRLIHRLWVQRRKQQGLPYDLDVYRAEVREIVNGPAPITADDGAEVRLNSFGEPSLIKGTEP